MSVAKKTLKELNIIDNFLFGKLVTESETREIFCKKLVEIILGHKINNIKIEAEKVLYGVNTIFRGARLDVVIENQEDTVIYDIEPDKRVNLNNVKFLPNRARFYHSKLDAHALDSGETYDRLKKVFVIFITVYDPFGKDRMVYTIRNRCIEDLDMHYEDGATTIFLYTKGRKGNPPESVRQLLKYMEHTTDSNVSNDDIVEINKLVNSIKSNAEVSGEYMNLYADFEYEIEQAVIQTREEVTEQVTEQVTEHVTDNLADRFIKYSIENKKSKEVIIDELTAIFGLSRDDAERYYSDKQS